MRTVLSFDLGASTGRAMLVTLDNGKIRLKEVHRFANNPVKLGDTLYWDFPRLMHEIYTGMQMAFHDTPYSSVAIDTWGVDFGMLDERGHLLENPVHYRDERTNSVMPIFLERLCKENLYQITGIQHMKINTVFQLASLRMMRPDLLYRAHVMLPIPNLIAYFLTGEKQSEYTIASTTELLDLRSGEWSDRIIGKLNLDRSLFPPIVQPGTIAGDLLPSICDDLSIPPVAVINTASHDTAAAVVAVPCVQEDFLFLSCGTWSLMGTELKAPVVTAESMTLNFTNEGGVNKTIRLLKNIMGLWIVQECLRHWLADNELSVTALMQEAEEAEPFQCIINPNDDRFLTPGNMPQRIRDYLKHTNQTVPITRGGLLRCVYESLALCYRNTAKHITRLTGKEYDTLYVVGGGCRNTLLMQMTADATGMTVMAGPSEATALGNALVQFIAVDEIRDVLAARRIVAASETITCYKPKDGKVWGTLEFT